MTNLIPLNLYTSTYYYSMLVLSFIILLYTSTNHPGNIKSIKSTKFIAVILLIFIVLFMGLRPISGKHFGDMSSYARVYAGYEKGANVTFTKDIGFEYLMRFCSEFVSVEIFFLLCAILYIIPLFWAAKKYHPEHFLFSFFLCVCSFSFWAYGTNGIRNGIATSFILLGMVLIKERLLFSLVLFALAYLFHSSVIIPLLAFALTFLNNEPKKYILAWFLSIILSVIQGGFWETFIGTLGSGDERVSSYLLARNYSPLFSSVGFRFDFLIYSSIPVMFGIYIVFKKKYKDELYNRIFNSYLVANAFWILVIRANFSNRIAYLSWFLMSVVIIYPLFKERFWKNQFVKVGFITVIYFLFTFIMNMIYRS